MQHSGSRGSTHDAVDLCNPLQMPAVNYVASCSGCFTDSLAEHKSIPEPDFGMRTTIRVLVWGLISSMSGLRCDFSPAVLLRLKWLKHIRLLVLRSPPRSISLEIWLVPMRRWACFHCAVGLTIRLPRLHRSRSCVQAHRLHPFPTKTETEPLVRL